MTDNNVLNTSKQGFHLLLKNVSFSYNSKSE